jgi:hypothetical protein
MRKAAAPKRASGKMKVMLRRAEGAFFLSSQTFATKSALVAHNQRDDMPAAGERDGSTAASSLVVRPAVAIDVKDVAAGFSRGLQCAVRASKRTMR